MRYHEFILSEALKPSEYRGLVKGWDRQRYAEIFKNPKYRHDRNGYRVYIPIETQSQNQEKSQTQKQIESFLDENGFDIIDYTKGIVHNREKKQNIKIGKVLNKLQRSDLLNAFNVDKTREGTRAEYMVVISRHPYDIAGMSTDRGWTSCMNLGEINRHYVPVDIKQGTVVAYVTKANDLDLKNPTGRVLIKPFVDVLGKTQIYFGIENAVYGTNVPGFTDAVKKWVNEVNASHELDEVAILKQHPDLYRDSDLASQTYITGRGRTQDEKQQLLDVYNNPRSIFNIANPTEAQLIAAISRMPAIYISLFQRNPDFKPSERVTIAAVSRNSVNITAALKYNIKMTDSIINAAIRHHPYEYRLFLDKDLKIPEEAISVLMDKHPESLGVLVRKNYKIKNKDLYTAVRREPRTLDTIYRLDLPVTSQIEKAAVDHGYSDIISIANNYRKKEQKVPQSIVNAFVKHRHGYLDQIFEWNRDEPDYAIPLTQKDVTYAIIKNTNDNPIAPLSSKIIDVYGANIENDSVVEIVKQTKNIKILQQLRKANKLDPNLPDKVLDYTGYAIKYIENPSPEQQMRAVKSRPTSIEYISDPSEAAANYAVKKNPISLLYIKKPTLRQLVLAAKHKMENIDWDYGESDLLDLSMFYDALERSGVDDETAEKLNLLLIKTEPQRMRDLIYRMDKIPEAIQLAAVKDVDVVSLMVNQDMKPSRKTVIASIDAGRDFYRIIEKLSYYNRYNKQDPFVFDTELLVYSIKKSKNVKAILMSIKNNNIPIEKSVANAALSKDPSSLGTLLSFENIQFDINKSKVLDALKNGAIENAGEIKKYYTGMVNNGITIDSDIMRATVESINKHDDTNNSEVIPFLNIQTFCSRNNIPINEDFLKYMIDINPRNVALLRNFDDEIRQKMISYAWKKHRYWEPLFIDDMVRVSNPNATPKYKITRVRDNEYEVEKDGEKKTFSKERIHRVNNLEPPK